MTRAYPPGWDRLTPNYFGMPFGILGLAAAWKAAVAVLAAPDWISAALLIFGAVLWLVITVSYAVKLGRRPAAVLAEFTDITLSPFGAFAPIAVMLLGAGLLPYARPAGQVIVALGSLLTLGYAGWWLAGLTYFNLYGLVMLATEAWLLPQYARLGFGVGDWVFAFSTAVIAADVLRWTASAGAPRWPAWLVLAAASTVSAWRTRSGPVTQPG